METQLSSGIYTTTNGYHSSYESARQAQLDNVLLQERIANLEAALNDAEWTRLAWDTGQEFSRDGLRQITELARIMALKNPLIKRGISAKAHYVWGQGMSVKAGQEEFNDVLQDFLDDEKNAPELTTQQARTMKERELETDGNLFFVFFVNRQTGRVRVRSIPFVEIQDIIRNPEDGKDAWYYKRVWTEERLDMASGRVDAQQRTAYYPDWHHNPVDRPDSIGDAPVLWDTPVYHVKVGGFSDWKFGLSEVYAAIDWSRAYKEFLEDWASIVRAYRRFAFQLSTTGGKRGIAAAKSKLQSTYGDSGTGAETNPPPVTGSIFVGNEQQKLTPVRTSGATVSAEDGRRLLLMVAASLGLPETFFGDVSVGTLATAKSLDRPTELMMRDRQVLWENVHQNIFSFVLFWAVKATQGPLNGFGSVEVAIEDDVRVETVEWNEDVDPHVDIDFPPLVQSDRETEVKAVQAADGMNVLDDATIARLLLSALDENDIDEILGRLYDENGEWIGPEKMTPPIPPQFGNPNSPSDEDDQQESFAEAVREMRNSLVAFREKYMNGNGNHVPLRG